MKLFNLKKGAMFGMDARIALAIFGMIGLISSATIYEAYSSAMVERLNFESKEIVKALKAYEYDVDDQTPNFTTAVVNLGELVSSAKSYWKGPYLKYSQVSGANANRYLVNKTYGMFSVLRAKDRTPSSVADSPFVACDSSAKCYWWILYEDSSYGRIPNNVKDDFDGLIDDYDGFLAGRVQKYNNGLLYRLEQVEQ